jgi:hypothetical protein
LKHSPPSISKLVIVSFIHSMILFVFLE